MDDAPQEGCETSDWLIAFSNKVGAVAVTSAIMGQHGMQSAAFTVLAEHVVTANTGIAQRENPSIDATNLAKTFI